MKTTRTVRILALSTSVLAFGGLDPVLAQEPDPNVPVTGRPRPEYDPLGLRVGNFLVFPSVTVAETYDDNVNATPDDEEDDFITVIQPEVSVGSNFPRHALGFSVGSEIGIHANESDNDYEDFFADADGRLDITRTSVLGGSLNFARLHEGRDDPDDPGADELSTYYSYGGALTFTQAFNRLNFRLAEIVSRDDYSDVGGISQDERDETSYDSRLRVGFFVSPRINVFTEGRYIIVDRDEDDPVDRDSQGWEARLGTAIDITAVLFGEAFVGYRKETFDDSERFEDEDGISFGADLTWNVTTLTTITLGGNGDFTSTDVEGASRSFESNIGLGIDHELLRNVLIGADVGYSRDDFAGIDRVDETLSAGANITYLINRYLSVRGAYGFADRTSDLESEEYTRNRFTISLTGQL